MNIALNNVSVIPVQNQHTPDRRKMSYNPYFPFIGPYFPSNNKMSKEKMSFGAESPIMYFPEINKMSKENVPAGSASKLNYFA